MDRFEKIAYSALALVAIVWLLALILGSLAAWPYGIFGLLVVLAAGVLFIKVIKERLANREDDYYSHHIDQ